MRDDRLRMPPNDAESTIRVDAGEGALVAVRPLRYGAEYRISVVVKVCLDLAEQGPARCVAPEPIVALDERDSSGSDAPLRRASEVAIVKSACDVTLVGTVRGAPPRGRIAIFRDGATLLDRAVTAGRSGGPALDVGPLAADAPARAALLQGRAGVEVDVPMLSPDFPWAYFQSAPRDLQTGFLRGDEWIQLEGFAVERTDARSRLPMLSARAALVEPSGVTPIGLMLDTLALDTDRWRATVLYRAVVPLRAGLADASVVVRVASGADAVLPADLDAVAARASHQRVVSMAAPSPPKPAATVLAPEAIVAPDAGAPFALAASPGARPLRWAGGAPSTLAPAPSAAASGPLLAPWMEARAGVTPAVGTAQTVLVAQPPAPHPIAAEARSPWAMGAPAPLAPPWPAAPSPPVPALSPLVPAAPAPAPVPNVSPPETPAEEADAWEDLPDEERDLTPPSRAALTAMELRNLGLAEEQVQQIMRGFNPAD